MTEYPNQYLHIREQRSGQEWVVPISERQHLDLERRVKDWIKSEFHGEARLDGDFSPLIDGQFYARIMTDNRPPTSVTSWQSGGFYIKFEY